MVRSWVHAVQENRGVNAQKTLENCETIAEYGEKTNDDKLLGYANYYRAETFYLLNEVDKVFYYITRGLEYLLRAQMWEEVAGAYNVLAIASINRGNAPFALDYYLSGLSYANKYKLTKMRYIININIGNLYATYDEFRQALRYFEESYKLYSELEEKEENAAGLIVIYISMANCYLGRDMLDRVRELEARTIQECGYGSSDVDKIYIMSFQARLANRLGKTQERDYFIQEIGELLSDKMSILDVFDDLYIYGEMLLDIGKYEELWNLVQILEKMAKKSTILNLQKRILTIKIKYYKRTEDNAGYLQASGLYYEMCELSERENRSMVNTMLDIRFSLEESRRKQRETETENQYLHKKSETDPLTGLANRYRFNNAAEEAFQNAYVNQSKLTIEILDIDYFKQFNDNYGHQAGDSCIIAVADAIKEMEHHGNIFTARYGGDEFILIYEEYSEEAVKRFSQELKKNIMNRGIVHEFSKVQPVVTISQGLCCDIPNQESKVWDFLHAADEMLYRGKNLTRNSICVGNLKMDLL